MGLQKRILSLQVTLTVSEVLCAFISVARLRGGQELSRNICLYHLNGQDVAPFWFSSREG